MDFRKAEMRAGPRSRFRQGILALRYLIKQRGATSRAAVNEVWGYDAMPTTRTVDVHVAWLRRKIEPIPRRPQYILTVRPRLQVRGLNRNGDPAMTRKA